MENPVGVRPSKKLYGSLSATTPMVITGGLSAGDSARASPATTNDNSRAMKDSRETTKIGRCSVENVGNVKMNLLCCLPLQCSCKS